MIPALFYVLAACVSFGWFSRSFALGVLGPESSSAARVAFMRAALREDVELLGALALLAALWPIAYLKLAELESRGWR